jgi:hypothetical protein
MHVAIKAKTPGSVKWEVAPETMTTAEPRREPEPVAGGVSSWVSISSRVVAADILKESVQRIESSLLYRSVVPSMISSRLFLSRLTWVSGAGDNYINVIYQRTEPSDWLSPTIVCCRRDQLDRACEEPEKAVSCWQQHHYGHLLRFLMRLSLHSDQKAKIKPAIPKSSDKDLVAHLYIAFPHPKTWTFPG